MSADETGPRRRGCLASVVLLGVAVTLAGAAGATLSTFRDADVLSPNHPDSVEVRPGETARLVVRRLIDQGVVIDDPSWELWVRWRRPGGCLQAGHHPLPAHATARELFDVLCQTTYRPSVRLTIPEGTNLFQLEALVSETDLEQAAHLLDAASGPGLLADLGVTAPSLEGYLMPDTYELDPDTDAEALLRRLFAAGERARAELAAPADGPAAEYSVHELLTIASVVEEEARVADEQPRIARVIYNRLARGMPLQCDATCIYGPDTWSETPTRALCRAPDNRWSTYVIDGLPPTPISNPGRSAIRAALEPTDDPDVLYFVAIGDGSGRHAFANDLRTHRRNVNRYIRGRP